MPIISQVGRRSLKVRLVIATIYTVLFIGAVSMIYPFLLMVSGSLKSDTDFYWVTPVPRFLWNDEILWMKYNESKYGSVIRAETALHRKIDTWRYIKPPEPRDADEQIVREFQAFRQDFDWPKEWYKLGHVEYYRLLAKNARAYRVACYDAFDGDLTAYCDAIGVRYVAWYQVATPGDDFSARRFNFPDGANYNIYYRLKEELPKADWIIVDLDADFWQNYLRLAWADIGHYNDDHGTEYQDYKQVLLSERPPPAGQAGHDDWEDYVREFLNLAFIRVDGAASGRFQQFLRSLYAGLGGLDRLNHYWGTDHADFDQIPLPQGTPSSLRAHVDYSSFLKNPAACPLDALSIYGPRQAFEQFVAKRRGVDVDDLVPLALPIEHVDYADFQQQKRAIRWEFVTRNYRNVIQYLWQHSNGIRNTIIFCGLLIGVTLVVNPLAAYALSRYRPPSTYTILLFCMATMAFPPEVTMIPSFLLLKKFPLYGMAFGFGVGLVAAWGMHRLAPHLAEWVKGVVAGGVGIAAGYWLAPWLCQVVLGRPDASVSLLNTFWALVLPGMANGFWIFLLKGFFDSLPQELYEAAEIDGAGEWTKFWTITLSLSKPILAVLALGAFTTAYSEFMMALVIIPDPDMWTIMIWLYQLQIVAHPTVIYASLVLAAIPTMVIFMFCQNIIIRGIVVPVEK